MIGEFGDDPLEIGRACSLLANEGQTRFLIRSINCYLGESVWATRTLSALTYLALLLVLRRLFFAKQRASPLATLPFLLHPALLFPVFYASQFSTVLTSAWAFLSLLVLSSERRIRPFHRILLLGSLAAVGLALRGEAQIYLLYAATSWIVFQRMRGSRESSRLWKNIALFLTAQLLLAFVSPFFQKPLDLYGKVFAHLLSGERRGIGFYPRWSHYGVQVWALLLYLKNFFVPFPVSFFGRWTDWWTIHRSPPIQTLLGGCFLAIFLGIPALVRRNSKKISTSRDFVLAGLFFFSLCSYGNSVFQRVDWYYPSRQFFGSLIFLVYLAEALRRHRRWTPRMKKRIALGVSMALALALGLGASLQYRSTQAFFEFENRVTHSKAPLMHLKRADERLTARDFASSLRFAYTGYLSLPQESLPVSAVSFQLWQKLLYVAYVSARNLADVDNSRRIVKDLMRGISSYSTLVCLYDPGVLLDECRKPARQFELCKDLGRIRLFEPNLIQNSWLREPLNCKR